MMKVSELNVTVESWFSGGVVVSFIDQLGVEYRGALLKRTDQTPVFEPSFRGLASPASVLHDHAYSHEGRKAWKRQLPAKLLNNNVTTNHFSSALSSDDTVCKRDCYWRNYEKRAVVVETDFVGNNFTLDTHAHLGRLSGRVAKRKARLKISEGYEDSVTFNKLIKKSTQKKPAQKKKQKSKPKSIVHELLNTDTSTSSPLTKINITSSLISNAQNCTVGLTPAIMKGVHSPLHGTDPPKSPESSSNSSTISSRCDSLSPTYPFVRPCSVSLKRIPIFQRPNFD